MYMPDNFKNFSQTYPEIFQSFENLGKECRKSGPLDEKTQNLVKLGISVGTNSRGGVMSSARKALQAGASKDEIIHVAILSLTTTGFPNMICALSWINEVLDK